MIEKELYSLLAQIGLSDGRVYPLTMPDNCEKPALVYSIINKQDLQFVGGTKYRESLRVQVDCYANSYKEVKELENETKEALYTFKYAPYELNSIDGFENETELYRQILDFNIQGE